MENDMYKKALLAPADFFANPAEIVTSKELSKQQKIEILKRWKHDAYELEVADDESMVKKNHKDILDEIINALRKLEK